MRLRFSYGNDETPRVKNLSSRHAVLTAAFASEMIICRPIRHGVDHVLLPTGTAGQRSRHRRCAISAEPTLGSRSRRSSADHPMRTSCDISQNGGQPNRERAVATAISAC